MSDRIRIACIGAGRIARDHLRVLRDMREVELVGILSRTRSKAEALASDFGIRSVFDSLDGMYGSAKPDGVLLTVSADQMFEVASAVFPYGGGCFLEKPAGLHPEHTQALRRLARQYDVKAMVGYNRRFYSVFHKGLTLIREHGALLGVHVEGHERMFRVRSITSHPEEVYNTWLYGNATHTIDLLRLFGGEVAEFKAVGAALREPLGDQFSASVRFEDGALGTYLSHWYSPGGWRVVLYGDGISVEFKPLEEGRWTDMKFVSHPIEPDAEDREYKPGFFGQMKAFVEMVRTGCLPWPGADLESAGRTMDLAADLAMAATGKTKTVQADHGKFE